MEWMQSKLAEKLGVTKAAIGKAVKVGNLVKNPKGRINDAHKKNTIYIMKKDPSFYGGEDESPNSKPNKKNGFAAGTRTYKKVEAKPKTKRKKKKAVTEDFDGNELEYDPTDIDEVLKVEKINKSRVDQAAVELKNKKLRGDLIETEKVVHILSMFIPEYKKRMFSEVEQHIRTICSENSVDTEDTNDYLKTLTEIMEAASIEVNMKTREGLEETIGEEFKEAE